MKPRKTLKVRSYKKRGPGGTYRVVRVKKEKKKSKLYLIVPIVIIGSLVFLFGMAFFSGNKSNKVYESDMVIEGILGQGESTPNFKVAKNHRIIIKISDYSSASGDSMVVELWGAGSDWFKVCEGSNVFYVTIDETNMYNIHFSVNRMFGRGQVSFHVRIEVE